MNITIMDYKVLLLLTLYILLPTNCVAKRKAKSVSTVIDAKWHLTPTVLEISEYLTEESENLFWEYVEYINSLQPALIDSASDKERYDRALGEAARLLSNPQLNLLKLSLSMHYNSPRVEMYHQIALDRGVKCPVAVDFGDKLVCHLDSLDETVNAYLQKDVSSRPQLDTFRLDHQFPGCRNDSLTVVLYGELGTPEFKQYHDKLKEYAVKKEINYIVRHFVKVM
uniref:UDP-glucose:glycoprotein glucosyltransferase n=1 Tax=Cacopsylla melanoneura TaxID=428564 RepID=A0A8D8S9L3_9HEMI